MLLLSAVFGVMTGLMLIYGTNLPQIDELTRYRPDATTELLDIHGQVIGSFALERRPSKTRALRRMQGLT